MNLVLTAEEIRILGVLIEKDMATPEYYPMSSNALANACNQKTNRDPIVSYDEDLVQEALQGLRGKQLIATLSGAGHRVTKYSHRAAEILNINNREMAVLCVLLLRGAQTLNEIKTRTESLYKFDDLESVELVLQRLNERSMTILLPKQPGTREPRWTHLIAGEPLVPSAVAEEIPAPGRESLADRVARLEEEMVAIKSQFAEFRRQFE